MDHRGPRMSRSRPAASGARHRSRRARHHGPEHDGRRRTAIPFPPQHRTVRSIGGPAPQLLRLPAGGRQNKRSTQMKTQRKTMFAALACCAMAFSQDSPKPPASVKVTRLDSPKALKFEVVVPAKLDDVWTAFTTDAGLNTWLWQDCT